MIKPDAVSKNLIGEILKRYEAAKFKIVHLQMLHLSKNEAEAFYDVHQGRPFFESLVSFISSGPVVAVLLEGEDVIMRHRAMMGATDPKQAAPGTIRADLGSSIEENVVHGSDSTEAAEFEIPFFFGQESVTRR